jgi:hypothetical protein
MITKKHRSTGGEGNTHKTQNNSTITHTKPQLELTKNRMRENGVLVLRNDQGMLGCLLHAPRGPFYSPKAARSRGTQQGRQFLPSVGWHTGQSGAPPDNHCSMSGADLLPFLAQPTIGSSGWLAHRTLSGAPSRPLAWATRRARILRLTVALAAVGSPDCPVHHRTVR